MYEWSKDEVLPPPKHLIRFMAHLVLFFRTLGMSTKVENLTCTGGRGRLVIIWDINVYHCVP